MNHKKELPIEEIKTAYELGMSLSALGRQYQVDGNTIKTRLVRSGIKTRSLKETQRLNPPMKGRQRPDLKKSIDEKSMVHLYVDKKESTIRVASQLGLSRAIVRRRLIDLGIPIRPRNTYSKKHTEESKNRIKLACRRGATHPCWKGGKVAENKKIRFSTEYANWRNAVFERDNWTCLHCAGRGGKLEADHILPFSTHPHARFDVSNGRTLCVKCHRKVTRQQIAEGLIPNNFTQQRQKIFPTSECT